MRVSDRLLFPLLPHLKVKPDVFIVGFQKCGTTSLYNYLAGLDAFTPGRKKEWNVLSDKTYDYSDYLSNFPFSFLARGRRTLSASHQMSYVPLGVKRLYHHFPKARVIFIMRNPVDRAFSRYKHNQSKVGSRHDIKFPYTFEELCNLEMELVRNMTNVYDADELYAKTAYLNPYGLPVTGGIYYTFVKPFMDKGFSCLFCALEDLVVDFEREFLRILHFLDVDGPTEMPEPTVYNSGTNGAGLQGDVRRDLLKFYKPYNEKLFSLIGQTYDWSS